MKVACIRDGAVHIGELLVAKTRTLAAGLWRAGIAPIDRVERKIDGLLLCHTDFDRERVLLSAGART